MKRIINEAIIACNGIQMDTCQTIMYVMLWIISFLLMLFLIIGLLLYSVSDNNKPLLAIVFLLAILTIACGYYPYSMDKKEKKHNERVISQHWAKQKIDTITVSKINSVLYQNQRHNTPPKQSDYYTTKSYYTYYIRTTMNEDVIVENQYARLLPELHTTKDNDRVVYDYLVICNKKYVVSWHVLL